MSERISDERLAELAELVVCEPTSNRVKRLNEATWMARELQQARARIDEAEKLLSEGYLGLTGYIYQPVAVLPPDGSMDSPWMKKVRDFLDRDLKPAEPPTEEKCG